MPSPNGFARLGRVTDHSMTPEAPFRMSKNGLVVDGQGWFIVNAREARWRHEGPLGSYCDFEGKRRFPHLGFNINVLQPGEAMGMYHRERAQEGFLVASGELRADRREAGAPSLGVGFLPLPQWDGAHHRRSGRRSRDRGGRGRTRSRCGWRHPLPRLRDGSTVRRERRAYDRRACRGLRESPCGPATVAVRRVPPRVAARAGLSGACRDRVRRKGPDGERRSVCPWGRVACTD